MNGIAPEIGLAVRSWRIIISYRYQYRYLINGENPASKNLESAKNLLGVGFCW
jgi:hypothetical protein